MDKRTNYSSGSEFEKKAAYSRAVRVGNTIYVSGTTGYDYTTMKISDEVVEQCRQCFENIQRALAEVGGSFADVVKVTYILPDKNDFEACWPILRTYLGDVNPAATMLEAGLLKEEMKIEIEVTAQLS